MHENGRQRTGVAVARRPMCRGATRKGPPRNGPMTTLDDRCSDPGTAPTSWDETVRTLETAELFWITTVRADGRPHMSSMRPRPAISRRSAASVERVSAQWRIGPAPGDIEPGPNVGARLALGVECLREAEKGTSVVREGHQVGAEDRLGVLGTPGS